MALKTAKTTIEQPIEPPLDERPGTQDFDLEEQIADQLLDDIDWSKVRSALLKKAPARLFAWLAGGNDTPVNISAFPELSALPSADDVEKAA